MALAMPGPMPAPMPSGASNSSGSAGPVVSKKRAASEIVRELAQLKQLKDGGVIDDQEFKKLRDGLKADI